jgi:hypothetical protein
VWILNRTCYRLENNFFTSCSSQRHCSRRALGFFIPQPSRRSRHRLAL